MDFVFSKVNAFNSIIFPTFEMPEQGTKSLQNLAGFYSLSAF